jgi:hypothetical protein
MQGLPRLYQAQNRLCPTNIPGQKLRHLLTPSKFPRAMLR